MNVPVGVSPPPALLEDLPLLFVDDEPEVLKALRRTVERQGWAAEYCPGPEAALEVLAQRSFSVVISDFRMPGMDGVQFLSEVRQRAPYAERILLTAHADADALERGINEAGIGRFLRKPWQREVLLNILDEARRQNRLRREHEVLQERLQNRNEELAYLNGLLQQSVEESTRHLSRIRRRWDVALGAFSDPLIIVNADYRVEGTNPAAEALAATAADQLEGQRCHEVLFGRREPCPGCPLSSGTGEVRGRDGRRIFKARAYRLPGEGGAAVCVYHDVTQEREFQTHAAHMDKMAAIGRLAGGMAHEINNPLHGILSFVQLAQKPQVPPEKLVRYHEVIRECALRCRDIVLSLRDFSRRAQVTDRSHTDLCLICEKALVLFRQAKTHTIEVRQPSHPVMVMGNANQLQQVLVNLVQNAIDASPEGSTLYVEVAQRGQEAVMTVEDAGPGVPEELREQIFEPFFTTKPEGVGTGLGLAISHNIATEHGGSLKVTGGFRGGARFELAIPLLGASHDAPSDPGGESP